MNAFRDTGPDSDTRETRMSGRLEDILLPFTQQARPPPPMVRTEPSHGSNHANHGAILQCIDQCLPGGGQAAVQPGSQAAPFQEHLGPFPEQADPLYWLLIKGLGRSYSEGDSL